jgi:hypothetical protein
MRYASAIWLLALFAAASGSEITHMPIRDVVPWAGTIAVSVIDSAETTETEDRITVELEATVLEVLEGGAEAGDGVACSYTSIVPIIRDEEGNEIGSASIEVYGSGLEFSCSRGDTVILLLEPMVLEPDAPCGLVRLESAGSRKVIEKILTLW